MGYGDGTKPRQRKDGLWIATFETGYTERGTRRRRSVTGKTEAECKRRRRDALLEYRADDWTGVSPRTTVHTWVTEWLQWYQGHAAPNTYYGDSRQIARWITPTIGNRVLKDLTVGDLRKVERSLIDADRSPTTVSNVARLLRRILRAAVVAGHKVPPPVLAAPLPSPDTSDRDSIPPRDAARVLMAASSRADWPAIPARPHHTQPWAERQRWTGERIARETHPSRWIAALVNGVRQGESLGLEWDRVDLSRGVMDISWQLQNIRAGAAIPPGYEARHLTGTYYLVRPKSRAGWRILPIVPLLDVALRDWRETCPTPDGLVWPRSTGGPMRKQDDLSAWSALQGVSGVSKLGEPYVLHEARHTTASLLTELGVPEPVIISIVGHSSIASTQRYRHADLTQSRAALDQVVARLALAGS